MKNCKGFQRKLYTKFPKLFEEKIEIDQLHIIDILIVIPTYELLIFSVDIIFDTMMKERHLQLYIIQIVPNLDYLHQAF